MFGFFGKQRVYLDYASAPPVRKEALHAMREAESLFGNPGGLHAEGVEAKRVLEDARERIAAILGVKPRELVFTSGLTEANNLAILGYARGLERMRRTLKGSHWIASAIEHDSVLSCFGEVERLGGEVSYANPNEHGIVTPEEIHRLLKPATVFVSVSWANNEIGTVQPLAKIARALRAYEKAHRSSIAFHADAGQGPLYLPTVVHSLGVDLLSLGSNKLYGPHGTGALFLDQRSLAGKLAGIILGGSQEGGLRAGTENAALALGFVAAFESVARERESESKRLAKLRDTLAHELSERTPRLIVNGDIGHALPHMLNISIPNISSEYIVLALDRAGIAISTKSACREGEDSSHVVAALRGEEWRARNTLRMSLGKDIRKSDISQIVHEITRIVEAYQRFKA
ncbi:cysteine desulfurase [Candidatus Parcubacteria bacterium]|nr:MAG: cysteine desulfurase [Candidatus Parcubacteria bacterium]